MIDKTMMGGVNLTNLVATAAVALGVLVWGLLPSTPARAEARYAAMVIDANSGETLHEQNADIKVHPASLTKMMTLYLAFEAIENGQLSYSSKLTISTKAASVAPSKLDLAAGEEIELLDAMKAVVTKSANDMAVAIAEAIGGTELGFVRLMNERAHQIGMRSTTFANASGLPDGRQVSTARDMLTLALHLQDDFPSHYHLFALKSFAFRGKTYRTHNTLMQRFPGMDGIKTGYTRASGYNLVSSVHAEGKHVVAALFGGATAGARNAHMRILLYRTLEKASTQKTRQAAPVLVARPKPAASPKPKPVAAAAKPSATEGADARRPRPNDDGLASETKASPSARNAEPQAASTPVIAASPPPPISVAKVRALTFPLDGDTRTPELTATASPADAQAQASLPPAVPKLDLQALREAISSEASSNATAAAPPASIEDLITSSGPDPSALGRPPSTLGEQAAALSRLAEAAAAGAPIEPPASAPRAPSSEAAPALSATSLGGGFEIQIGAYSTAAEAENRMDAARSRASALLDGHRSVALPAQSGGRQVFRARFVSFDETKASATCAELRRSAIDCIVMRAE